MSVILAVVFLVAAAVILFVMGGMISIPLGLEWKAVLDQPASVGHVWLAGLILMVFVWSLSVGLEYAHERITKHRERDHSHLPPE